MRPSANAPHVPTTDFNCIVPIHPNQFLTDTDRRVLEKLKLPVSFPMDYAIYHLPFMENISLDQLSDNLYNDLETEIIGAPDIGEFNEGEELRRTATLDESGWDIVMMVQQNLVYLRDMLPFVFQLPENIEVEYVEFKSVNAEAMLIEFKVKEAG